MAEALPELNIKWYSFSFIEDFWISPILTLAIMDYDCVDQSIVVFYYLLN